MTLRVGIGGPVGSGKTALMLSLCRSLRDEDLGSFAPGVAILSSKHETQYSRLFRS